MQHDPCSMTRTPAFPVSHRVEDLVHSARVALRNLTTISANSHADDGHRPLVAIRRPVELSRLRPSEPRPRETDAPISLVPRRSPV